MRSTLLALIVAGASAGCSAVASYASYGVVPIPPPARPAPSEEAARAREFMERSASAASTVGGERRNESLSAQIGASYDASTGGEFQDADHVRAPRSASNTRSEPRPAPRPAPTRASVQVDAGSPQGTPPATSGDEPRDDTLRVYRANLVFAVFDVRRTQDEMQSVAESLGGYLAQRSETSLVLRVPAEHLDEALGRMGALGQLVQRDLEVDDVTEQFRDLELRIHTLEVMRAQFEALLARATTVADALAVQEQLERVTVELESLRGRLRLLSHQVRYATVTIRFDRLATDTPIDASRPALLRYRWVRDLGLSHLLQP